MGSRRSGRGASQRTSTSSRSVTALFALVAAASAAGLDAEQALRQRVRREMAEVRVHEQRGLRDELPPDQAG